MKKMFSFGIKDKMIKSEKESNPLKGENCHENFPFTVMKQMWVPLKNEAFLVVLIESKHH